MTNNCPFCGALGMHLTRIEDGSILHAYQCSNIGCGVRPITRWEFDEKAALAHWTQRSARLLTIDEVLALGKLRYTEDCVIVWVQYTLGHSVVGRWAEPEYNEWEFDTDAYADEPYIYLYTPGSECSDRYYVSDYGRSWWCYTGRPAKSEEATVGGQESID